MIAIDTNILLPAVVATSQAHPKAAGFLRDVQAEEVVISELMLIELYGLL